MTKWECLEGLGKKVETRKKKRKKTKKKIIVIKSKKDYAWYLKSKRWKDRKEEFWKKHDKVCFCCNGKATELHHCCYARIGKEKDKDLVAICRDCHSEITDMVYRKECKLKDAHIIYQKLLNLDIYR